ncbi:MAG: hypothetical protein J3K34DRAFT_405419 [Monoraphidium minutum]|nr:MAG: hypothetical protein J3K34DRAFT_405419 [Monoraphidium minutum]
MAMPMFAMPSTTSHESCTAPAAWPPYWWSNTSTVASLKPDHAVPTELTSASRTAATSRRISMPTPPTALTSRRSMSPGSPLDPPLPSLGAATFMSEVPISTVAACMPVATPRATAAPAAVACLDLVILSRRSALTSMGASLGAGAYFLCISAALWNASRVMSPACFSMLVVSSAPLRRISLICALWMSSFGSGMAGRLGLGLVTWKVVSFPRMSSSMASSSLGVSLRSTAA